MNNFELYSKDELKNWVNRSSLLEQEGYLIDKFIKNRGDLIEAGTGGGRIAIELNNNFPNINIVAFDFVIEMIEKAKEKNRNIDFKVNDASNLSEYQDKSFDYAIYLQQIVSFIPFPLIPIALKESYRILKDDGIVIFSFLNFKGRKINFFLSLFLNSIRIIRGEKWSKQELPWLKLRGKLNFKFLHKDQATVYWFEKDEVCDMLKNIGFEIVEIKTSKELIGTKSEGMLYIVCKKINEKNIVFSSFVKDKH